MDLRHPALVPAVALLTLAVAIAVAVIAYQGQTHPILRAPASAIPS